MSTRYPSWLADISQISKLGIAFLSTSFTNKFHQNPFAASIALAQVARPWFPACRAPCGYPALNDRKADSKHGCWEYGEVMSKHPKKDGWWWLIPVDYNSWADYGALMVENVTVADMSKKGWYWLIRTADGGLTMTIIIQWVGGHRKSKVPILFILGMWPKVPVMCEAIRKMLNWNGVPCCWWWL